MIVTVHRGTREIGGNCIEVATPSTRLILDVGLPLVNEQREPFDSFKALRSSREQLIADGTIKPVPGLFTDDAPAPDGILLSHAHLDHVGLLHHSRPLIPIYATTGTSKMMLAGGIFASRPTLDRNRHRAIKPGSSFTIGDFTVTPYAVDHSTFGCLAFLIEAGGKTLLYSGDLRRHGRKPGMIRTLIDAIASRNIDVLLMEGTHLGGEKEQGTTEFELEERVVELVKATPGLVLAAFSPQDVDRLVTLYRSAQRSGRTFVADAYAAFILHLVAGEANIPRPTRDKGIRVYFNAAFRKKGIDRLNQLFEPDRIDMGEILADPGRHLMAFRPSMTTLDFNGQLPERVRVLYGYWKGYLTNPDWLELRRHVAEAGGDFILAHASGHIYTRDLRDLVTALNPKAVIPIHTFEPALFGEFAPAVQLLRDGQSFHLSGQ
jgi:ribonuclease J